MLLLTKSIISLMLGFIVSMVIGIILIPILKKSNVNQMISKHLNERHLLKVGTPTMGGFIFVLSTLIIFSFLVLSQKIILNINIIIILIVFVTYGIIGFIDDFFKVHFHNNKGLSILTKFFLELFLAIIFFYLYMLSGGTTKVFISNFVFDLQFLYGMLILFLLTFFSNAVNITDGLDGLCTGLSCISFLTYGIIAWNSGYIIGNDTIAIFCFILSGSLIGFLFFNFYPAKVFMGDLGSLALGGTLATVAILLKNEVSLLLIGMVYIIEIFSSAIQVISIRLFNKKIFLKSPLHHHFEMKGYVESDIIKIFYITGLFFSLIALLCFVWL